MICPVLRPMFGPRTAQICDLLIDGFANGEIAQQMGISADSVKARIWEVKEYCQLRGVSRTRLAFFLLGRTRVHAKGPVTIVGGARRPGEHISAEPRSARAQATPELEKSDLPRMPRACAQQPAAAFGGRRPGGNPPSLAFRYLCSEPCSIDAHNARSSPLRPL